MVGTPRAFRAGMQDDFDEHAGKPLEERHPLQEGGEQDPSDFGDLRVAQPGDDPADERALSPNDKGR